MPGEYYVDNEELLVMTTLGSCIAACLYDRQARIGGMNHFMLPEGSGDSGRYGSYAMELLINEMMKRGATRMTMEAKVFLSLIHISEPTRLGMISYAVFCL